MQAILAVFLITLSVGQLGSTFLGWRAASLVGPSRLAGYSLGILLFVAGALLLPGASWLVLGWTLLAGPLALALLLLAGSYIAPPPHPDCLFEAQHPAHGSCAPVQIPDGEDLIPGFLLRPPAPPLPPPSKGGVRGGVLIVHGAGDTKTSFKWRLVQALLIEGFTVLTIDLPGHGDYRHRLLAYPDCLSVIPTAIQFLRQQPGVEWVGLVGISLGSALAIKSLAQNLAVTGSPNPPGLPSSQVDALVALETPLEVRYSRQLYYGEMWNAYRAPVLSLLREVSVKQLRQSWFTGGYRSRHKNTGEVIELLNPLENMARLSHLPILLVHGGRDIVAPPPAGLAFQRAAPQAEFLTVKKASHVTLTLMPEVNRQVARWLREKLEDGG
jgi:pimeloyl-ACP methyl ester carboxylesterase